MNILDRFLEWKPLGYRFLATSNFFAKTIFAGVCLEGAGLILGFAKYQAMIKIGSIAEPMLDKRWRSFYKQLSGDTVRCVRDLNYIDDVRVSTQGHYDHYARWRAGIVYDSQHPLRYLVSEWTGFKRSELTDEQVDYIDRRELPIIKVDDGTINSFSEIEIPKEHVFPSAYLEEIKKL